MKNLHAEQQISASPERVFAITADLERLPEYVTGIARIEKLTDGPTGTGTRFRETRVLMGKAASQETEIAAFEPGRRLVLVSENCGVSYETEYRFVAVDGGTRLEVEMQATPLSTTAKLVGPLIGWMMRKTLIKCLTDDLADLKRVAEQSDETLASAPQPV